jgi:tetraacyldisaccharide-1-P 4'-kinase
MARCPPANQHTAKTKTTQGHDYRASKWVIVIGNDLVGGSEKQTPQLRVTSVR